MIANRMMIGSVLMGKRPKKATMKGVDTMECPCRGCTDRTITCHGVCQRYQDWKKNREDVNNWLIKQRPITSETAAKKFREKVINLYRMRKLIRDTVKLQWRVEQEQSKATKITAVITGMPRGTDNHSKVEDGAIRLTDLQEAYDEVLGELERMRKELDPLLNDLSKADDRAVMRLRYMKGFSPEDIADAIHRTDRSIYYYLSRAENELVRLHSDKVKSNG